MNDQKSEVQPRAGRLNRAAVLIVFFGLLSLPILWFGRTSFVPALTENRILEPFPRLSIQTFQRLDRWFSDRFGMRDALVYYGSRLQMARTGTPQNPDVVVSPSRWLFFDQYYVPGQPHFADMFGKDPLSSSQLQQIAANLNAVRAALDACNLPFYFIIAPDKHTVYPEKLGVALPKGEVLTGADQLTRYLKINAPQLAVIDLRQPLKDAKANAPYELYKRTDSHWNSLGAFYGYQAIAKRLAADRVLPNARLADLQQWRVTQHAFDKGDIAVSLLSLPGYFEDFDTSFNKLAPRTGRWIPAPKDALFTESAQGSGKLLLYHDSFSGELMPFLAEDFSRIWAHLGREVDGDEIQRRHPSVVALQIVERNVRKLADPPKNLEHACRKP